MQFRHHPPPHQLPSTSTREDTRLRNAIIQMAGEPLQSDAEIVGLASLQRHHTAVLRFAADCWEFGHSMQRASMACGQLAWEFGFSRSLGVMRSHMRESFRAMMAERFPELAKPVQPYHKARGES